MIVPPNQGRIEKMLGNLRLCLINEQVVHLGTGTYLPVADQALLPSADHNLEIDMH